MASRLINDTILTIRKRRPIPDVSGISRAAARRAILILTLFGLLLFLYLTEVSQVTTSAFDIEQMELEYRQWQERNQELERQISELESPQHVLRYAEEHGMVPRTEAEHLIVETEQ